jgi:hypothetical protein
MPLEKRRSSSSLGFTRMLLGRDRYTDPVGPPTVLEDDSTGETQRV